MVWTVAVTPAVAKQAQLLAHAILVRTEVGKSQVVVVCYIIPE